MFLHKIKLAGFKSFVDPTTVVLPSNLVGVVGPNGCGKSNVADALRWVMGEISAKHLRGGSMADVVFNGSTARKPVGLASVEILIDNAQGRLGGQYAGFSELAIRRQVARDGQSTYFLNGKRCRRRDVTDVFLGTGLGPRSYAIIEQGMVSRLVEAKPDDLREFIEEAAGVSKYKERRKETENRIRHTRENLDRLQDILDELGKRLAHLERQAKLAEKYTHLKQKERLAQAELLAARWRALAGEAAHRDTEIREQESAMATRVSEQSDLESRLEARRAEHTAALDGFNERYRKVLDAGAEVARREETIENLRDQATRIRQTLRKEEETLKEATDHLATERETMEKLEKKLAEGEPALAALTAEATQAASEHAEAEAAMQAWSSAWEVINLRLSEATQSAQAEEGRMERLKERMADADRRSARLREEQRKLDITGLEKDISALAEEAKAHEGVRAEAQSRHARCQRIAKDLDKYLRALSSKLDGDRERAQEIQGRLASLAALQQDALGKGEGAAADWLRQHQLDGRPRLAERLAVAEGWEWAVEHALGDNLRAVCVAGLEEAVELLPDLQEGILTLFDATVRNNPSPPPTHQPESQNHQSQWQDDGSQPETHESQLQTDGSQLQSDRTQSEIDVSQSQTDRLQPETSESQLQTNGSQLQSDRTQSEIDVSQSQENHSQLQTDPSQLQTEEPPSQIDQMQTDQPQSQEDQNKKTPQERGRIRPLFSRVARAVRGYFTRQPDAVPHALMDEPPMDEPPKQTPAQALETKPQEVRKEVPPEPPPQPTKKRAKRPRKKRPADPHSLADSLTQKVSAPWPLDNLLAGVRAADDLTRALALRPTLAPGQSVVTPAGEWLGRDWLRVYRAPQHTDGAASEAAAGIADGVLAREREIKALSKAIGQLRTNIARWEKTMEAARGRREAVEQEQAAFQTAITEAERRHAGLESQLTEKQARLAEFQHRGQNIAAELAELDEQLRQIKLELEKTGETLQEQQANRARLGAERDAETERRKEYQKQLADKRTHWQQVRDKAHGADLQMASLRAQYQSLTQAGARESEQLQRMEGRCEELRGSLQEMDAPLQKAEGELTEYRDQHRELEAGLQQERRRVEELDGAVRESDQARHAIAGRIESDRAGLEKTRLARQEIHVRQEAIGERITAAGHAVEALLAALPEETSEDHLATSIQDLGRQIARLGPINLAAVQEHAEQSAEKDRLDAQHQDLTDALATLETAIQDMDRETRTRFTDTFEKVNAHLNTLFPRLFGGGVANLELAGDDLLSAGVTIMARPPGKRNSTIAQLSGGEKALTAVALVFALFELNPAPFCLLDEVDAPLDDANVYRFRELVEEMSARVQFILITHNKNTMEVLGQLVGVTMSEPGVSRLVSVDMDRL